MFDINKILVPTDFSDNASAAYHPAQQLAGHYSAQVDVIHIIPTLHYFNASMSDLGVPLSMEKEIYPKIQEQSSRRIQKLMDDHIETENRGEGIVKIATKPSKAIPEHAWEGRYDLIVMATHGKHESDLLRGSITEKVIRYSKVPVLSTDTSTLEGMRQILVPTDGSQTSLEALPPAISLASAFNRGLILFYVMELYGTTIESTPKDPLKSDTENIKAAVLDRVEEYLALYPGDFELQKADRFESRLIRDNGDSGTAIPVRTIVKRGISAHYAITGYAEEYADMVVMATHGRSGLAHMFLGSTTEKVVQHLKLPVLTVNTHFDES